jgi:hypothetical protein
MNQGTFFPQVGKSALWISPEGSYNKVRMRTRALCN